MFSVTITDRSDTRRPRITLHASDFSAYPNGYGHIQGVDPSSVRSLSVSASNGGPERLANMAGDFKRAAAENGGLIPVSPDFIINVHAA